MYNVLVQGEYFTKIMENFPKGYKQTFPQKWLVNHIIGIIIRVFHWNSQNNTQKYQKNEAFPKYFIGEYFKILMSVYEKKFTPINPTTEMFIALKRMYLLIWNFLSFPKYQKPKFSSLSKVPPCLLPSSSLATWKRRESKQGLRRTWKLRQYTHWNVHLRILK